MVKKIVILITAALFLTGIAGTVSAALLTPVSISGGGGAFYHSENLIIDGTIPTEGSGWQSSTNTYWSSTNIYFTLDYGSDVTIEDVVVSVDNNDYYKIDYSSDGNSWTHLMEINKSYGEIGWGMDTMSSINGDSEYISYLDFSPVDARYLKIYATAGDSAYSIGELQAFGNSSPSAVPEPSTIIIFGCGILGLAGITRKKIIN